MLKTQTDLTTFLSNTAKLMRNDNTSLVYNLRVLNNAVLTVPETVFIAVRKTS